MHVSCTNKVIHSFIHSCTVTKIWSLNYFGVTTLTSWGHATAHVRISLAKNESIVCAAFFVTHILATRCTSCPSATTFLCQYSWQLDWSISSKPLKLRHYGALEIFYYFREPAPPKSCTQIVMPASEHDTCKKFRDVYATGPQLLRLTCWILGHFLIVIVKNCWGTLFLVECGLVSLGHTEAHVKRWGGSIPRRRNMVFRKEWISVGKH